MRVCWTAKVSVGAMELERDPNMRRRLDGQQMLDRDELVATLREQGVPFRVIAAGACQARGTGAGGIGR